MNQNNHFQRLRLFDQAQKQFNSLKSLKNNLKYQQTSKDKDEQILMLNSKVKNLISLYENILSQETSTKVDNKQKQTDNVSYRRSHSRTKLSLEQTKIKNKQINAMIVNSTLTCTIAYLQTNFLGLFQEAATTLLKSKDELSRFMQKLKSQKDSLISKSGRKSHFSNFGLRQREYNKQDQQQSERSSISLSKFYTISNHHTGAINKLQFMEQNHQELYLVYIRTCINLVINLILLNRHTFVMEIFNQLVQTIQKLENQSCKAKIISYIFGVWFNIQNQQFMTYKEKVKSIRKNLSNFTKERLSLQQAVSLSHFIFNSDLFSPQQQDSTQETYPLHFINILQKSIQTFLQNSLFQLAFFTLRHLLQSPISPQLKQNYYIQLREMLESGKLQEDIQLQNIESVQCFKSIIDSLNALSQKYLLENKLNEGYFEQSKIGLFQIVVKLQISKIFHHPQVTQQQKDFLIQKLLHMKNQTNYNIVDSMLSQKQSKIIILNIEQKLNKIVTFTQSQILHQYNNFFENLKTFKNQNMVLTQKSMNIQNTPVSRSQAKLKMISPSHSRKFLKVISTSVLSENSSHHPSNSQKHKIFQSNISTFSNDHKKVSKMVRLCQYGGFLNKRNFNSDGGQIKFIKITNDKIKWSKNPQKIDESSHSYPLKDIKGIIYGKLTPNFKKSCNKQLKEQFCFSLILQKRTMDFYCKDYKQVESWVCGISSILKKQNPQIPGYTPGKMRWRKMFTILRQAFIQPLKIYERNRFYFQNAYSLILFKQNGYKLLSTKKIL